MSSVVNTNGKTRTINNLLNQLSNDFGFDIKLCKPNRPETKGSNKARNKLLDHIRTFDVEFEKIDELYEKVKEFNHRFNTIVCQETNVSPNLL